MLRLCMLNMHAFNYGCCRRPVLHAYVGVARVRVRFCVSVMQEGLVSPAPQQQTVLTVGCLTVGCESSGTQLPSIWHPTAIYLCALTSL